jgi:hypothetical protein
VLSSVQSLSSRGLNPLSPCVCSTVTCLTRKVEAVAVQMRAVVTPGVVTTAPMWPPSVRGCCRSV